MKSITERKAMETGRWIRPVPDAPQDARLAGSSPDDLASVLIGEARKRIAGLSALERQLEDRIRARWDEAEVEAKSRLSGAEEEIAAARRKIDGEAKERYVRAEKEGRGAGFREGFARGREEGYRLGLEEGRRDGHGEGLAEATRSVEQQLSGAASAIVEASARIREEKEKLLHDVRGDLIRLAVEIAKKLVQREIREVGDVALRSAERAVELIFRRGILVLQVNPEDAEVIRRALEAEPRWAEGFDSIEVRPMADVRRGGCRLVSGACTVDMTLESQMALIEEALDRAAPESPGTAGAGLAGADAALEVARQ